MTTAADRDKYTPAELPEHATTYDSAHPEPEPRPPLTPEQRRARFPGAFRHGVIG